MPVVADFNLDQNVRKTLHLNTMLSLPFLLMLIYLFVFYVEDGFVDFVSSILVSKTLFVCRCETVT